MVWSSVACQDVTCPSCTQGRAPGAGATAGGRRSAVSSGPCGRQRPTRGWTSSQREAPGGPTSRDGDAVRSCSKGPGLPPRRHGASRLVPSRRASKRREASLGLTPGLTSEAVLGSEAAGCVVRVPEGRAEPPRRPVRGQLLTRLPVALTPRASSAPEPSPSPRLVSCIPEPSLSSRVLAARHPARAATPWGPHRLYFEGCRPVTSLKT